jgi:hypothetical protein
MGFKSYADNDFPVAARLSQTVAVPVMRDVYNTLTLVSHEETIFLFKWTWTGG